MKKILLLVLVLTMQACKSEKVVSEHIITNLNETSKGIDIIVDGDTLLDLEKDAITYEAKVGDSITVTSSGKEKSSSDKYLLKDNYLYLDGYNILEDVESISLIKESTSLTKKVVHLEAKDIFQDQTGVYSVEQVTPLKIADIPDGSVVEISYFKEADTKDYTLLSSVYQIRLIDDSKKYIYLNVINDTNGIIVNNYYDEDYYKLDNSLDLHTGDRILVSYESIGGSFDDSDIYYKYKGKMINEVKLEKQIIKASDKKEYRVRVTKFDGDIYVGYKNNDYQLVAENGFSFKNYKYKEGSYLRIIADKEIDQTNKKITGVIRVIVEV